MQQVEAKLNRGGAARMGAAAAASLSVHSHAESLSELAHDVRNMVTALTMYCELLQEPGVLSPACSHYGRELNMVAASSRRLVEKMMVLQATLPSEGSLTGKNQEEPRRRSRATTHWEISPSAPVEDLSSELLANRNLLAALAGAAITLTVDVQGGAKPVTLTGEELTRVLVNLVKNATEAMPGGGRIQLRLTENESNLVLSVEDSGPGIPEEALETIFLSGWSTREKAVGKNGSWPAAHRGLGLAITRSIVESAGGRIYASNCPGGGAAFCIELPVRRE